MRWSVCITEEAKSDLKDLDGSIKKQVLAGIYKISLAPLPAPNGYGKPLGNKAGSDLSGFFKIKYKGIGIRVIYSLVPEEKIINIIVISLRDDNYCYDLAERLYHKYGAVIFKGVFELLE